MSSKKAEYCCERRLPNSDRRHNGFESVTKAKVKVGPLQSRVLILAANLNSGADVLVLLDLSGCKVPLQPELWLRADGFIPTHSWFTQLTKHYFLLGTAGHSFRPGSCFKV